MNSYNDIQFMPDIGLREWEKPKTLENPYEDNYTEEQIERLIRSYNKYLEDNSHLYISIREGKVSKKTGKIKKCFSVYNMNCSVISDSDKKNVWTIITNEDEKIFKDTLEQCLRYLVKHWYVIPVSDVKEKMLAKL
jgi:hypothetical protein